MKKTYTSPTVAAITLAPHATILAASDPPTQANQMRGGAYGQNNDEAESQRYQGGLSPFLETSE